MLKMEHFPKWRTLFFLQGSNSPSSENQVTGEGRMPDVNSDRLLSNIMSSDMSSY